MKGVFYILLCWLAGNLLSDAIGNYISGNIIGMVLMFAALRLRIFAADDVRPAAKFLLGSMALYFVPFGVGLMTSYTHLLDNLWLVIIAITLSTVAVLAAVGLTFQYFNRRSAK